MARAPREIPLEPGATVGLKWNETTREKLRDLGRIDPTDADIAAAFRVSVNTWRNFKSRFPEAGEDVLAGKAAGNVGIKSQLLKKALAGSTRELLFLAERRLGYQAKQLIQNVNESTKLDMSKLSTKELEQWLALHEKAQPSADTSAGGEDSVGTEPSPLH